jgi:PAS domain-containing protein
MVKLGPPAGIFESAHEAFVSMDAERRIVEWNARAAEMFGCDRSDAIGMTVAEAIITPAQREAHRAGLHHFHLRPDRARRPGAASPRLGCRVEAPEACRQPECLKLPTAP